MKYFFLFAYLITFNSYAIAQIASDTVYFDSKWKKTDKANYLYYRVIDKLANGKYKYTDCWKNGTIQMIGELSKLSPETWDGKFIWYNSNGSVKEITDYRDNHIIGTIKHFDINGKLDLEYVSELDSLDNADKLKAAINDFVVFVSKKIEYPKTSYSADIQGKVITSFFIDKNGRADRITITKSVNEEIDNEAKRIVKLYRWPSPVYQGQKTMFWVVLPITFSIR